MLAGPPPWIIYGLASFPRHMLRAGMVGEATSLLANERFIRGRMIALGLYEGGRRQVDDVEELCRALANDMGNIMDAERRGGIIECFSIAVNFLVNAAASVSKGWEGRRDVALRSGRALCLIGRSLAGWGCWRESLKLHERSLEAFRSSAYSGQYDAELMASIKHNLSLVHYELEDFDSCLKITGKALSMRERLLGKDHFWFLQTLHQMGKALTSTCKYSAAVSCYNKAMDMLRQDTLKDKILIANILESKGTVLFQLGETQNGMECLKESLCWKKEELGDDHPILFSLLVKMGGAHAEYGNHIKALGYLDEALYLTNTQPNCKTDEAHIATLLAQGQRKELSFDHDEAISYYEKALKILSGCPHRKDRIADVLQCMGQTYMSMGDNKTAEKKLQDSIQARRLRTRRFGLNVAETHFLLGNVYQNLNKVSPIAMRHSF